MKNLTIKVLLGTLAVATAPVLTNTSVFAAETSIVEEADDNDVESGTSSDKEETSDREDVSNREYDFSDYSLDDFGIDYDLENALTEEELNDFLYEKYGKGECGENLTYEYNREKKLLEIEGEGELEGFDSVADLPWVVFYDEYEQIKLNKNVKIKLWQASKKSAEMSNHLGDYEEVVEKLIEEAKEEALVDTDYYKDLLESLIEKRTLFNRVLDALEMSEDEFNETYGMDINEFLDLYENDMDKLCEILGVDSIDDLLKGIANNEVEETELITEADLAALFEELDMTEEEFFEMVDITKEELLEMTKEEFEEFIKNLELPDIYVTMEDLRKLFNKLNMTEEEFFDTFDITKDELLSMTKKEFEKFVDELEVPEKEESKAEEEEFDMSDILSKLDMTEEEFYELTGLTAEDLKEMSSSEIDRLIDEILREDEKIEDSEEISEDEELVDEEENLDDEESVDDEENLEVEEISDDEEVLDDDEDITSSDDTDTDEEDIDSEENTGDEVEVCSDDTDDEAEAQSEESDNE